MDTYKCKVDFSGVKYFSEIHEVLKRDLDLPDYYGGHLDALWDCLTDQLLSGLTHIEIVNFEKISTAFSEEWKGIMKVFRDTKHAYGDKYSDRFFVFMVWDDGTREEIK